MESELWDWQGAGKFYRFSAVGLVSLNFPKNFPFLWLSSGGRNRKLFQFIAVLKSRAWCSDATNLIELRFHANPDESVKLIPLKGRKVCGSCEISELETFVFSKNSLWHIWLRNLKAKYCHLWPSHVVLKKRFHFSMSSRKSATTSATKAQSIKARTLENADCD